MEPEEIECEDCGILLPEEELDQGLCENCWDKIDFEEDDD